MPRISTPPTEPRDIWTYAIRELTSGANIVLPSQVFPFTNPASPVDLPNVQAAISPTGTGREAKLDNLDIKVSEAGMTPSKLLSSLFGKDYNPKLAYPLANMMLIVNWHKATYTLLDTVNLTAHNRIDRLLIEEFTTLAGRDTIEFDLGAEYSYVYVYVKYYQPDTDQRRLFLRSAGGDSVWLYGDEDFATADVTIQKTIAGVTTQIATLGVDRTFAGDMALQMLFDKTRGYTYIKIAGDELEVEDADLKTFGVRYVRLHKIGTTGIKVRYWTPLVILYE